MDDWEDDLLALAEAPAPPKKKKDKKKKRKRESSGSASDMDVSGGSDVEVAAKSEAADSDDEDRKAGKSEEVLYPYEGIYKDAADKARLAAMTEIDRESELEERREKLQQSEDRRALKQMYNEADGGAGSDSDSKPSAMARRKGAAGERGKKLDELKKRRQDKSARDEKRARRAKGEEDGSDADDDDGKGKATPWDFSDDEDEDEASSGRAGKTGKSKNAGAAEEESQGPEISTVDDISPVVLQRGRLAEYWPRDFFPDYVKDAYVRIGVGMYNGAMEYRLAQVVGISETKATVPYELDKHRTDMKLTLAHGEQKQDFKMDMISNSAVTPKELHRYLVTLRLAKMPIPTTTTVKLKTNQLRRLQSSKLTEAELSQMLAKKREAAKLNGGGDLHHKHTLTNQRDIAKRAGNAAEVERINAELARFERDPEPQVSPLEPIPVNGSPARNGPMSLEDRRRNLALKAKSSVPASKPASGTSTPQRVPEPAATQGEGRASPAKGNSGAPAHAQTSFQKLLASKVDIDLGDF